MRCIPYTNHPWINWWRFLRPIPDGSPDMYLLVGASNDNTIQAELDNVAHWASSNNLRLNPNKTSVMVISKPGSKRLPAAATPAGIEHVSSIKVLGVTLQNNLRMNAHISEVISGCSSSLYALCVLRNHGLPPAALYEVCRASIMARLMYASPAWWGFANAGERSRHEGFIAKTMRFGYLPPTAPTAEELSRQADTTLFKAVTLDLHRVLHDLLPATRSHGHNLRARAHNYVLPAKDDRNFMHYNTNVI